MDRAKRISRNFREFWYALALLDLLAAVMLFAVIMTDTKAEDPPTRRIEYKRECPKYDSEQHTEVLEVGKMLDESKIYLLAKVIYGESGSDWCSDMMQLGVGSVVLNRIKSDKFPSTMEEVIFQGNGKQYACVKPGGGFYKEPSERALNNARTLISEGSIFPEEVLYQANFKQGKGTYLKEQNMYFCY